ncbi:MAG TPA: hypothetical protein VNS52_17795, partial [Gemmatimonadaceae bacterium]|nr:hypothetical protein [Gemmatimonadaceae bacterium]
AADAAPRQRPRQPKLSFDAPSRRSGKLVAGIGMAAAALGAAAYLLVSRGAGTPAAPDPVVAQRPAERPDAQRTVAPAAVATPTVAQAAPLKTVPQTTPAVASPATPGAAPASNVPTGPVVAALPSARHAPARRPSSTDALPEPPMPHLKAIRLDGVTRDIEARAKKGVDDATRVVVKQNFKQP